MKERYYYFIPFIVIFFACAPTAQVNRNVPKVCDQLPPDVFTSAGINIDITGQYAEIVSGKININTNPTVVSLASKAAADARIRDHLRCLAKHRDGYSDDQVAYHDILTAFMATNPKPAELIEWQKSNKFPTKKDSSVNSNFNLDALPSKLQEIVLTARQEAQKAELVAEDAREAEIAGNAAAAKAQRHEDLFHHVCDDPFGSARYEGEAVIRYEGKEKKCIPSGFGKTVWLEGPSAGESFTGQIKDSIRVRGVFEYPNPDQNSANKPGLRRYEGKWQPTPNNAAGNLHGNGIIRFRDGSIYKGQINAGAIHGYGQLKDPDGLKTEGRWENWRPVPDEFVKYDFTGRRLLK